VPNPKNVPSKKATGCLPLERKQMSQNMRKNKYRQSNGPKKQANIAANWLATNPPHPLLKYAMPQSTEVEMMMAACCGIAIGLVKNWRMQSGLTVS
jgi:hypothetical protein